MKTKLTPRRDIIANVQMNNMRRNRKYEKQPEKKDDTVRGTWRGSERTSQKQWSCNVQGLCFLWLQRPL